MNIAEEAVRRVTGASLLFCTTSDVPASSMPFSSCVSDAASAAAPIEENMSHFLQAPHQDDQIKSDLPNAAIPVPSGEMASRPASLRRLRRVASLENLQKRIHGDSIHSETASTFSDPEIPANDK